jgi:hypothetical protein
MKPQKILALCVLSLGLWACHQPGPAERAGKRVDAITGNETREAQRAGRHADQAAEDLRKARDEVKQ